MKFLFLFLFVAWLGAVLLLPFIETPDQSRIAKDVPLRFYFQDGVLTFTRSKASDFRLVLMRGDNLRIYLRREEFETAPYPDRSRLVKIMATPWCEKASYFLLPTVCL